jgi:hypothetical protein
MILPKADLNDFVAFVKRGFGVSATLHDSPMQSEYARFMLGGRLFIVSAYDGSENLLEILSGDKNGLQELGKTWMAYIYDTEKEDDDIEL